MKNSITFKMLTLEDTDSNPNAYLFQDPAYQEEDQALLEAWRNDEWRFIGIQAQADILIVSDDGKYGTSYTLKSAGLWGIESDSGDEYLKTVFEEQKADLLADLKKFPLAVADYVTEAGKVG